MITKTTTSPCVLSTNPMPNPLPDEATFNARYWAAQDPKLQERITNNFFAPLDEPTARTLAESGLVIDVNIMCWGWSPWFVNFQRLLDGYTWSPSALQPAPSIAPGAVVPGMASYDPKNPPVGAISNSLNLADWPAAIQPAPPPVEPSFIDLVGFPTGTLYNGLPIYNSAPKTDNSAVPANGMFWNSRGEFQKISVLTIFGTPQIFWVLVQATATAKTK